MKNLFAYIGVFSLGLLIGFYFLWRSNNINQSKQIDVISNGIKNVSKLIVQEAEYTELYNYKEAKTYFFETIEFQKKIILLVTAKVQVSYDLRKLEIEIDSTNKQVILKSIPDQELTIVPSFKYYDLQQSMWNTFTKEDLNKIQKNSLDKLLQTVAVSEVKHKAKKRLVEEINNLLSLAQLVNWKVVDNTNQNIVKNLSFNKEL